ncbi:uncharacterized protein LOC125505206 isoform X2 [Dendroctonus ponderosae]|uniref:uncharacterized protein LOC125505206 isoform X2 n=1 Tax=Dendroctonus ponderosae TaxID=77166 RepID=UPI0020366058|nr:uncharacterized protein LOC125505206 isoform X2 [Dendroctonus ponderosae]
MKTLFVILVFTHVFSGILPSLLPFGKLSTRLRKPTESNDSEGSRFSSNQPLLSETSLNQAECKENCGCLPCNLTLPKPKKVINPYKKQLSNRVAPRAFGSFCIKCAACLAVANEVQTVIEKVSQECETDMNKKKIVEEQTLESITRLCQTGFRKQAFEHHGILTDNFECTQHPGTVIEENWTKRFCAKLVRICLTLIGSRLREMCNLYISRVDVTLLTSNTLDSIGNLTDMFCRGSGVFRDCSNIKTHRNISLPHCKNCGH